MKKPIADKYINQDLSKFKYLLEHSPTEAQPEQYFHSKNGDVIRSISEMKEVLVNMEDFIFYYHQQANDFANWVKKTYHNHEFADLLKTAESKQDMIKMIDNIGRGDNHG